MSQIQILSLIALAAAVAWIYAPQWKGLVLPQDSLLQDLATVQRIRQAYNKPAVEKAAKELLEALLQ